MEWIPMMHFQKFYLKDHSYLITHESYMNQRIGHHIFRKYWTCSLQETSYRGPWRQLQMPQCDRWPWSLDWGGVHGRLPNLSPHTSAHHRNSWLILVTGPGNMKWLLTSLMVNLWAWVQLQLGQSVCNLASCTLPFGLVDANLRTVNW